MKTKLVHALLFAVLFLGSSTSLLADGGPRSCTGTYLIDEDGGATALWTIEADGAFFATSSLQALINFSDQQGNWERDGHDGIKAVVLALVFRDDGTLQDVSRVDISLHAVGQGCDNVAGTLVVRAFEEGEDPLDPSTDDEEPIATDTVSGRRVK